MLDKGSVLQEVRIFSANPLKPKACYSLLSRILWVMLHGEPINKKEATDVFFGVTKLFQSKDVRKKRFDSFLMLFLAFMGPVLRLICLHEFLLTFLVVQCWGF